MNLEVIRAVLEVFFKARERGKAQHQRDEHDYRRRIEAAADRKSEYAARPKADGRRQSFDLVARAEEYRVDGDDRDADDGRRRDHVESLPERSEKEDVEHHRHRRRERDEDKRAESRRMALARALAPDYRREQKREHDPEKNAPDVDLRRPLAEKSRNYVFHYFFLLRMNSSLLINGICCI